MNSDPVVEKTTYEYDFEEKYVYPGEGPIDYTNVYAIEKIWLEMKQNGFKLPKKIKVKQKIKRKRRPVAPPGDYTSKLAMFNTSQLKADATNSVLHDFDSTKHRQCDDMKSLPKLCPLSKQSKSLSDGLYSPAQKSATGPISSPLSLILSSDYRMKLHGTSSDKAQAILPATSEDTTTTTTLLSMPKQNTKRKIVLKIISKKN